MTCQYTEKDRLEGYLRDFTRLSFLFEQIMYEVPRKGNIYRNFKSATLIVHRLCNQTNKAIEKINKPEEQQKRVISDNLYPDEWPKISRSIKETK